MRCPNCEAAVPEGSRFCNNCGHSMPEPSAAPQPPGPPPPVSQTTTAHMAYARPAKDPNSAMIIELVGTFFGLMGLGWLYAGHTNRGIIALVTWLVVVVVAALISVLTGGLFACLWLPAQIAAAVISALQVKQAVERDNRQV
jgi:TM2 domain-containing membrane protein YozV